MWMEAPAADLRVKVPLWSQCGEGQALIVPFVYLVISVGRATVAATVAGVGDVAPSYTDS